MLLRSAVKLVGSRRPVGKPGETHCVFPGLNSALCCLLFTPTSHVLWTGQPLAYPAVQKSGAAAEIAGVGFVAGERVSYPAATTIFADGGIMQNSAGL